jgi:demethylmenaquinone methyltransferase/2-methoxy-6-polyprenyl-1,4-benzoquinol methylase
MFDHFNLLAPIYERVIPPPDVGQLKTFLRLPADGLLLDAGGGTGRVSAQLRSLVDHVVLTDVSGGMLKQAIQKERFLLSLAHAERLPFPDESFSRILVVDALHHFCNQGEAVSDLLRVLEPGGRLVIEEPDLDHWQVKMIALAEKLALMRSHFYSPTAIGEMVERHGLSAEIRRDDTFTAWIIVDK